MASARSMMYIVRFNSVFFKPDHFFKLDFVKKIFIYENYIILALTTPKYITSIKKLLTDESNVEIYNTKQMNTDKPMEIMSKELIIKQPEQKENMIVVFANGKYFQREVIAFVVRRIVQSMKSHSKERGHDFDYIKMKPKLLEAFLKMDSNYRCGCNRKNCTEIMQLYGPNGISPDRENNDIGYCDDAQNLTLVVKSHNTLIKPNSVSTISKSPAKWYSILMSHMKQHTKRRIDSLIKKKQQTELDKEQIKKYANDKTNNNDVIEMLKLKKQEQKDLCKKCGIEMYFGNADDVSELTNCGNKVSPDRKNNDNVFYDSENFDLVCCSCNFAENQGGRTFVENKCINKPIPFTAELLQKTQDFLKLTNFKRRKVN
jgi:hypothetical protein